MMSFFRYRTLDEIKAEVERLGLSEQIRFASEVKKLLKPIKVGDREIWNSLGYHPMEGCDGTADGRPSALTWRRYERLAAGGGALIWFEATAVLLQGRANPRQICLTNETAKDFEAMLKMVRKVHKEEFGEERILCGIQLTHSGRYCFEKPIIAYHDPALDKKRKIPPDYPVISDSELDALQDAFVNAAKLAWKIGFDFVDIKQCHRYLLSELLAAKTRNGKYGESLKNRTRFACEVIQRIQQETNGKLLIATRMNAYDGPAFDEHGKPMEYPHPFLYGFGCDERDPLKVDLTEPITWAKEMTKLGVKIINVTMGNPYANPHIGRPFDKPPVDGYEPPEHPLVGVARHFNATAAIKQAVGDEAIVVGTGYSFLRQFLALAGEANKESGLVDIVAVGRGALAYPDYVRDLLERGQMAVNKVCLAVSFCTTLMRTKEHPLKQAPTGCVPRDPVYAELYRQISLKKQR
ncbi:MAG: NADH:flavin oxidoreductase [Armatimonadetes bacterium]|nr:NADH:flavin oxidoreductase [Armatimonadota bacterium]